MTCMNPGMGCGSGQRPQPCETPVRPSGCQPCNTAVKPSGCQTCAMPANQAGCQACNPPLRPSGCQPCGRPVNCQCNTPVMPQPWGVSAGTAGSQNFGMQGQPAMPMMPAQPMQTAGMQMSKRQLMKQINEASFAMDDVLLFLDTHPNNMEALQYYKSVTAMRRNAMAAYQSQFGPLMVDDVTGNSWSWVTEKWPWEGGC